MHTKLRPRNATGLRHCSHLANSPLVISTFLSPSTNAALQRARKWQTDAGCARHLRQRCYHVHVKFPAARTLPHLEEVIRFDSDIEAASSMSHRNVAPSLGRRSQFESGLENREQTPGIRLGLKNPLRKSEGTGTAGRVGHLSA